MQIGLGCVGLGTASGGRTYGADVRLVEAAIDAGVTVLDTADAYGSGMSERVVGDAIRRRREQVQVATKGGYVFRARTRAEFAARRELTKLRDRLSASEEKETDATPSGGGHYASQDFSPAALRGALERSLRRLRTDHVDVYQLHGPPRVMPGVVPELQQLVREGKIRRLGIGAESVDAARSWSSVPGIEVIQLPYGVLDPDAASVIADASARHIAVWARGVFGGGLLAAAAQGERAALADRKWPLIAALSKLAARHDIGLFELAFGFVRDTPGVSTILLGMSSKQHLDRNLAMASSAPLGPELVAEVSALLEARPDAALGT